MRPPGLLALKEMVARLAVDHANARRLAMGLEGVKGLEVKASEVDTNIVYVRVVEDVYGMREIDVQRALKERGIWMGVTGVGMVRFVVHYEVEEQAHRPRRGHHEAAQQTLEARGRDREEELKEERKAA